MNHTNHPLQDTQCALPADSFLSRLVNNPVTPQDSDPEPSAGSAPPSLIKIKRASEWIEEARLRPDPVPLWLSMWYEGEISCLFADSNLGKSIYAVEIARKISRTQPVIYFDFELSDKQFQLRYTDENGYCETFGDNFHRAEIDNEALRLDSTEFEERIMESIEEATISAGASVIIIDNLSFLCNNSDKSDMAGRFMLRLIELQRTRNLSILVLAHTPKRSLSSPITQNDLAGSKKLFNFFDSVFAIGKSAVDESLRYIKQLKVRAGSFDYDSSNVMVCEIVKDGSWLHFERRGFAHEKEHLKESRSDQEATLRQNVIDYRNEGKTIMQIAALTGLSKTKVGRICKDL